MLSFTGCGFFDEETGKMISKIEKTGEDKDGNSEITVYYTDPYYKPEKFIIPAGKQGYKGNSVIGIDKEDDEDANDGFTTVTITLENTDEKGNVTIEKKKFDIPDGKTITDITTGEENGENVVIFTFNSGLGGTLTLPMPDFNGVNKMQLVPIDPNDETKGYKLQADYTLTEGDVWEDIEGVIKPPVGIADVEGKEENGKYVIYVYYTDGREPEKIPFNKPEDPNTWSTYETVPGNLSGKVGDFCYVENENAIYAKVSEGEGEFRREYWKPMMTFADKTTRYNVYFYKNDGSEGANDMPMKTENIQNGYYFASVGKLVSVPRRDGYKFMGWYTSSDYDYVMENKVVMSSFTDLTPVNSDLKLYAIWEPIQ